MTRLQALLVSLGVALAGGVLVTLSRPADDATLAQLVDAGLADCPLVALGCEVRASDALVAAMEDRGVDGGRRYRRLLLKGRDCTAQGAGYVVVDSRMRRNGAWRDDLELMPEQCRVLGVQSPDDGAGTVPAEIPSVCACRKAVGLCRFELPDGGLHAAPFGTTIGPGYPIRIGPDNHVPSDTFAGAGCQRKNCLEVFGESSWPENCPESAP